MVESVAVNPKKNLTKDQLRKELRVRPLNPVEKGSSGTMIFGGIFDEEYLSSLSGTERADEFDKMERSDDTITMLLTARRNPILRASRDIIPPEVEEKDRELAEKITAHVKHELFTRMDQDMGEIFEENLSMLVQGYSLIERIHEKVDDPKFGLYIGYKKLGWRSQRTIERWELARDGTILEVYQQADGDVGSTVYMDGQWLTVFTLNKRGDNYEGISALRPIYGNWRRKQMFLKLLAIGIERYAINTPVGTIPAGYEGQEDQVAIFQEMLESISSHEKNWATLNAGWEVEFLSNPFDVEKVVKAIVREDEGMVKSFVANHLNLGSGGSGGAYALGNDFSESFLSLIENDADIIARRFNKEIIKEFVDINYGKQAAYPKLVISGINDKFGAEFADVLKKMADAKIITATTELETFIRDTLKLPPLTEKQRDFIPEIRTAESSVSKTVTDDDEEVTAKFSEESKRIILKDNKKKLASTGEKIHSQLVNSRDKTARSMQKDLKIEADKLIASITSELRKAKPALWSRIIQDNQGIVERDDYKLKLERSMAEIAARAITQAKNEVPNGRKIALFEGISSRITLANTKDQLDKLGKESKAQIQRDSTLVSNKQLNDMESTLLLSASNALEETQSVDEIASKMRKQRDLSLKGSGESGINGSIVLGAANTSAMTYNTARNEFLTQPEILAEVEAFLFDNPAPVTAICKDLKGTVFTNFETASRFAPPLHHNCKSYLVPIFEIPEGTKVKKNLRPSRKELEKDITL